MLILQFSNYIFTHVMVKSIFLEKNIEQKKTFISFSSSLHLPNFYLDVTIKHVKSFQLFFSHILFLSSVTNNWWGLFKEECNVVTCSWLSPGFAHLPMTWVKIWKSLTHLSKYKVRLSFPPYIYQMYLLHECFSKPWIFHF